jgi:hypothetical protein
VRTRPAAQQRQATARAGTSEKGYKQQDQKRLTRELASEVIIEKRPIICNSQLQLIK